VLLQLNSKESLAARSRNRYVQNNKTSLMKLIFPLIILIILGTHLKAQDKFDDKQVKKYFSLEQIKVLKTIIAFVDSNIVKDNNNIRLAYINYFISIDSTYELYKSHSSRWNSSYSLTINQDIKERFLFNLQKDVFNKIWTVQIPMDVRTRDTTLFYPENFWSFSLNNNGDYIKLLKALGKKDNYYKVISNQIEIAGNINPTIFAGMFNKINELDFNKFTDRLWIAIFLLTIEDPTEIRVAKYLEK
jgi:hypothetical protein